jgi:hypothetical protein
MHAPAMPHSPGLPTFPLMHTPATQQPSGQDAALHVQEPASIAQYCPSSHAPGLPGHTLPQPSPSPQPLPVQLGTQVLQVPASEHASGRTQAGPPSLAQHASPRPPQWDSQPASTHAAPLQHPLHRVGSHVQRPPFTQRWPSEGQGFCPDSQTPPQPSPCPQGTSGPQLGVQPQ